MKHPLDIKKKKCVKCDEIIDSNTSYCPHCGQKNVSLRTSFGQLIQEFWENFVQFDVRVFRTLLLLLIPGKLTNEFFKGKRKRFMKPLRLFIFLSIASLSLVNYNNKQIIKELNPEENIENVKTADIINSSINLQDSLLLNYPTLNETDRQAIQATQDSIINRFTSGNDYTDTISLFGVDLKLMDLVLLEPDSLISKYNIQGKFAPLLIDKAHSMAKDSSNFIVFLINKIGIGILFMLPFLALFMKTIYMRKDVYYAEHFIFSLHYHSFIFLAIALHSLIQKNLLSPVQFESSLAWLFAILFGYLFFSLKSVYKQSIFITLFKFLLILFAYSILISTFILALLGLSVLFF